MLFTLKNISDDSIKYSLVITSLTGEVLIKLVDVIRKPALENKYHINQTILECFS